VADAPQTLVDGLPRRMIKCVNGSWQRGSHPAYEGVHVDGHELTVPRPPGLGEAVGLDLGNLIEDMGLTTWFYDTWYRWLGGLREMGIDDVDGLAIDIEDPTWWRDLVLSVAHRQGLGDDIAEGLARFYERHPVGPEYLAEFIQGRGSRGHSWHREGRAMEPHPSPYWEYSALLYAVSTRDVTPSTHGFFFLNGLYGRPEAPLSPDEISPVLKALAERVYGSEKAVYPGGDEVEQVTAWHQHRAIIKDSLGLCDWVFPVIRRTMPSREALQEALERGDIEAVYGDIDAEATLLRAATGLDMGTPALERAAARVVTLERCLDVRNHGRDRDADEVVVTHYQWTEKTDRTHVSARADEFRALLDRYYDLRGWSRETGAPLPEALRALGLEDVVAVEAGASTVGE
jgi:aldehyde:ferredoxin oxidoreductase